MKILQFQSYLKEKHIDITLLIHPDPAITYFTQAKPSFAYLIITPHTADLYCTALDRLPQIQNASTVLLKRNWHKRYTNSRKIGVNKESLTVQGFEKLRMLFPRARFIDLGPYLHSLRAQKTAGEIKKITKACRITGDALHALIRELPKKHLKTENDVAFFLEQKFKGYGATGAAFPTIVAMGRNAVIPHHKTSNARLTRGFLLIDFGAEYQHYCADMTRMLFLGRPTKAERELYRLLLNAQVQAIHSIAEGIPYATLDTISRKHLGRYSSYCIHSLGHGIGIEVHEAPHFLDKAQTIQRNNVFTIEPGIYLPGKVGLRVEDTVLFDGKTKILTTFPKELIVLSFVP